MLSYMIPLILLPHKFLHSALPLASRRGAAEPLDGTKATLKRLPASYGPEIASYTPGYPVDHLLLALPFSVTSDHLRQAGPTQPTTTPYRLTCITIISYPLLLLPTR